MESIDGSIAVAATNANNAVSGLIVKPLKVRGTEE